ncbi:MAG: hypothetical protein IJL76_01885 [Bacilli bacterium]|nr:hypothetical protein [Bacilli bacterium]
MNKENLQLLYIQTIDSIDTIYINCFYTDINQIKSIRLLLKNWYKSFEKTYTLKEIKLDDLLILDLEINNYFNNYSNKNIYVERLYRNYNILIEEWKNQIITYINEKSDVKS